MGKLVTINSQLSAGERFIRWIKGIFTPYVTVNHIGSEMYQVRTKSWKYGDWKLVETRKGTCKNTAQVVRGVLNDYPGHLLYFPKEAFRKAAAEMMKSHKKRR